MTDASAIRKPEIGKTYYSIKRGRPTFVRDVRQGYVFWSPSSTSGMIYPVKLENFWRLNEEPRRKGSRGGAAKSSRAQIQTDAASEDSSSRE